MKTNYVSDKRWGILVVLLLLSAGLLYATDPPGTITTVAGDGTAGYSGDGGPATSASLVSPRGLALDSAGNLFIADFYRIRRVEASTGIISTVAGGGPCCFEGDGGPATDAHLFSLYDVALDAVGNLFIAQTSNNRIRRVDAASAVISSVAGDGNYNFSGDGGLATSASLANPYGVAVDAAGNVFIADTENGAIRRVDAVTQIITTYAGASGFDLALDRAGNLFIAEIYGNRIRRVEAATGIITTVAGDGNYGFSGDGGPATSASLYNPSDVAVDRAGNLFIADSGNNRIRRVDAATGIISTVAGNGNAGFSGDGGPASNASLAYPWGVALDKVGNLFITDGSNLRIRRVEGVAAVYDFVGFLPPVENLPIINLAQAGRTIPVRWQLPDGDTGYVSSLSSFASLTSTAIACDAAPTAVVGEQAEGTGATGLRYESGTDQFVYNWRTTKGWSGCRLLTLTLADGTHHYAKFKF